MKAKTIQRKSVRLTQRRCIKLMKPKISVVSVFIVQFKVCQHKH